MPTPRATFGAAVSIVVLIFFVLSYLPLLTAAYSSPLGQPQPTPSPSASPTAPASTIAPTTAPSATPSVGPSVPIITPDTTPSQFRTALATYVAAIVAIFFGTNQGSTRIMGANGFIDRGYRRFGQFLVPVVGQEALRKAVTIGYVGVYLLMAVASVLVVWVQPRTGAGADLRALAAIGAGSLFAVTSSFFFGKSED